MNITMDIKKIKKAQKELRKILNEWDFLALGKSENDDEYDCIMNPILSLLQKGTSKTTIQIFIQKELQDHFNTNIADDELKSLIDKISQWWKNFCE